MRIRRLSALVLLIVLIRLPVRTAEAQRTEADVYVGQAIVGFLRYRKKDYRGALAAFRAGRTNDPQIQQLTRLYTGLALAGMGLPAQAVAEVEQAIRLAPASAVTGPAERLRDAMVTARERE